MATIKEALQYAANNPDSDFARNFGIEIATGKHDQEAAKFGIDTTPIKQKYTPILQAQQSTQNQSEKPKDGIVKSIVKDAAGTLVVNPVARATEAVTRLVAPNSMAAKGYEMLQDEGKGQDVLGINVPSVTGGARQITGEALKTASYLFPYGKAAGLAGQAAGKIGGNVISGATGGYLADAGYGLTDPNQTVGEALTPGAGTAIGAAIPLVGPTLRATGRATAKLGSKAVESVIPTSSREAGILQTYKANNPFFKRVSDVLQGTEQAPTTAGKTATTQGLIGTKSGIGVQAKRASDKLWSDVISPRLKASEQAVDLDGFFNKIQDDIIANNPELSRQKSLLNALQSFKDDYAGINSVSLEKLQKLKEGWAEFVPEKFYKGENIAGNAKQVQALMANEARQTIYSQLGDDVKQAYFDYGNLQGLKKLGQVSMTGQKLKGGTGGLVSELLSQAITPIGTVGGQAVYKIGKGIEFVGNLGAKNLGEALGVNVKFPGDAAVDDISKTVKKAKSLPNQQGGFISLGGTQDDVLSLLKKQDKLTTISNQSDEVVKKFAGSNGLVPDSVKNNPDYIKASNEAKKAFQDLRNFNASSEGKKLQSEMKKLGIVERQKLRKSLSQDANLPTTTQSSQIASSTKNTVIPKSSPKSTTKSIDSLIKEAKKYKSAEDIVVYRGGEKFDPSKMKTSGKAIGSYFSNDKNFAQGFTDDILSGKTGKGLKNVDTYQYVIKKGANILKKDDIPPKFVPNDLKELVDKFGSPHGLQDAIAKWAKNNGFDVIDYSGNGKNLIVVNPNIIK